MITVYGIPNCNTMKKTFDWLKENKIDFQFHDYKKKGIDQSTLELFIAKLGENTVLNRQGATYKQLTDAQKLSLNDNQTLFEFLTSKTSAIKRPILERNGQYLAGFDEEKMSEFVK
jgi:arsenate reductase